MSPLFFSGIEESYNLHPVVVFTILDGFTRRQIDDQAVYGALLGFIADGQTSVEDAFVVPHTNKEGTIELDYDYFEKMNDLYCKANPRLSVIGWFTTNTIIDHSKIIINNQIVSKFQCVNPLLLTVDTSLTDNKLSTAAYTTKVVSVDDKPVSVRFDLVNIITRPQDSEKLALQIMVNNKNITNGNNGSINIPNDSENLTSAINHFNEQLDQIGSYLTEVINGTIEKNEVVAADIASAVSNIPSIDAATFDKIFGMDLEDMRLLSTLSEVTRQQINIADKINVSLKF